MQGNEYGLENHSQARMDGKEFNILYHGLLFTTTGVVNPENVSMSLSFRYVLSRDTCLNTTNTADPD